MQHWGDQEERDGRVRRAFVCVAVLTLAVIGTQRADAHPGTQDAFGGHVCKPGGGGAADCAQFGLGVGEYHCETDACRERLQDLAAGWCAFGIPIPTRGDMTGVHFSGELTPPIRVIRRTDLPGHVLEVHRTLLPNLLAPQACFAPSPGLTVHLTAPAAAAHRAAPDRGAVLIAEGAPPATTAAAAGFDVLRGDPMAPTAASDPSLLPGLAALAWFVLRGGRRGVRSLRRHFWQAHARA
jgi:hypothetical protein